MYNASALIKKGKSIDIPVDPEFKKINENLNQLIFNGGKVLYPWSYEQDSSDRFHLLDRDNTLKLCYDQSNRDDFEGKIGSLVDYLGPFEDQMKVIKSYVDYTNLKGKELKRIQEYHHQSGNINPILSMLSEINKTSKKYEICWDAFIFSIAKFFLSDEIHDEYKTVFYSPSKKKNHGQDTSKETYDSINKELFHFFDEYGLEKQGYISFLDFLGDIRFAEHDFEDILRNSMDYERRFNDTFNKMYSDFFNNQNTMIDKYNSMVVLKHCIRSDIKHMSHILEKFVFLDSLSEIYDAVEMQKSNIDDIKSLETGLSGIESDIESTRNSMTSFAGRFKALNPYEVYALCYLISKHDEIQSYGTLDKFLYSDDFKDGLSSDNKLYYKDVKRLFKKIPKNKTKGPKRISNIQDLFESEPEYKVHKIQERLLLENISTIKGEIAGLKKGFGSMNSSLKKAIEYMSQEKIDTAIFNPDKPDGKLDLSELVDLQELLKVE